MAKRSVSVATMTPTAVADAASFSNQAYPFLIQGQVSTQRTNVLEVQLGGQAGASSPTFMLLSRDSQIAGASGTGLSLAAGSTDAALDASTAALTSAVAVGNTNTSTQPNRSSTLHLLNLSFNAFGGIVRWVAAPGEEISMVGNTASLGEISLSAFTGGTAGLLGAHMIYETA